MLAAHLYQKLSALIPKDESFAIAFSGGGDSTALVHALKNYPQAKRVYIVDHGLREGSAQEALSANDFAESCGYQSNILDWKHNAPTTALQEKARKGRYGLMGAQCRIDGIKYLLTAHSEDDQAETVLMRYDRKTDWRGAAGMAELTYGPVWPELAMVNVVRPLLGISRRALRVYNNEHKLQWTEDPSNKSREYTRIRARDYLAKRADLRAHLLETAYEMQIAMEREKSIFREAAKDSMTLDEKGIIYISAKPFPELMFHYLRVASGSGQLVDRAKIKRLLKVMEQDGFKSATLGGALVARQDTGYRICRDPVAVTGRRDSKLNVQASAINLDNNFKIWDGRWAFKSHEPNFSVISQHSLADPRDSRAPAHIITQPVLRRYSKTGDDYETLQGLNVAGVFSICLVKARLEAALGGKLS